MLSKFCASCGTPSSGGKFCMNCGNSLEIPDSEAAAPVLSESTPNQSEPVAEPAGHAPQDTKDESTAAQQPTVVPPQSAYTPPQNEAANAVAGNAAYSPLSQAYAPTQGAYSVQPPVQGGAPTAGGAPAVNRAAPPVAYGAVPGTGAQSVQSGAKKGGAGKTVAIVLGSIAALVVLVLGGLFVIGKIDEGKQASAPVVQIDVDQSVKGNDCFDLVGSSLGDVTEALGKPTGKIDNDQGMTAKYSWGFVYFDKDGENARTIRISKANSGIKIEGIDIGVPLSDAVARLGDSKGYSLIGEETPDGETAFSCEQGDQTLYLTLSCKDGTVSAISIMNSK